MSDASQAAYCHMVCPEFSMSVKKADPDIKTPFNYIVCLDIVVLACILVVAGRPDGLAITVSAIIVAVAALCYRGTVGVKSYMSGKSRNTKAGLRNDERASSPTARKALVDSSPDTSARNRSWLRDSE
jgi:hypothetical protein